MPVYNGKVEIWSDVTIAGRQTNEKGKIELLSHGPWKAEMSNCEDYYKNGYKSK